MLMLMLMLMLIRGNRVSDVARTLCCARSSVGCWINWFTLSGVCRTNPSQAFRAYLHVIT